MRTKEPSHSDRDYRDIRGSGLGNTKDQRHEPHSDSHALYGEFQDLLEQRDPLTRTEIIEIFGALASATPSPNVMQITKITSPASIPIHCITVTNLQNSRGGERIKEPSSSSERDTATSLSSGQETTSPSSD